MFRNIEPGEWNFAMCLGFKTIDWWTLEAFLDDRRLELASWVLQVLPLPSDRLKMIFLIGSTCLLEVGVH
jgi:hypothetical protein